jgi:hypothetical protein
MSKLSTFALVAAIAAATNALPAFAQSFDPEAGSGNIVPFSYTPAAPGNRAVAVRPSGHGAMATRQEGLHAFAAVPGGPSGRDGNDPALTGGGSVGYNQMLERF